jgi:hypothetical protein
MKTVDISFHDCDDQTAIIHNHLDNVGLCKIATTHLAVPLRTRKDQQSILLRYASSLPDVFMDAIDEKTIPIVKNENNNEISMTHPLIVDWLSGCAAYFVVYFRDCVRITKIKEVGQGTCVKQNVMATLVTTDGDVFVGTNRCNNPQEICPRDVQGMKSGEGYHLCKEVCQQVAHAEVDATTQAGENAKGAIVCLTGHTYACQPCKSFTCNAGASIEVNNFRLEQ